MTRLLLLTDGKAGHENQSRAFARALGGNADVVAVRFPSKVHKALSYLADRLGLRVPSLVSLSRPVSAADGYRAVIGTGSGTFYAVKTLARRLGVPGGVVLYPRGYALSSFSCILAPSFDRPAARGNVIEIPANLVAADEAFYARGVDAFAARFDGPTDNLVGVIIGGPNKCSTMTVSWMKEQLDGVFAANPGAALCVTTSRRTPPAVEALVDSYPWAYKLIYSKDRFNPIPAFVRLARRLYVTAESTGMLSEACTSGTAEVVVLDNLRPGRHKFRRFVEVLREGGYVDGARKIDLAAPFARARTLMGL
jgi:mitochondrial fission protein ELM1